jgi:hypothetical protein
VIICAVQSYCDKNIKKKEKLEQILQISIAALSSNQDYMKTYIQDKLNICYNISNNIADDDKFLVGNAARVVSEIFETFYNILIRTIIGIFLMNDNEADVHDPADILKKDQDYVEISKQNARTFFSGKRFTSHNAFEEAFIEEFGSNFSKHPIYIARIIHFITAMMKNGRKMRKNDIFDSIILFHIEDGASIKTFDQEFGKYLDGLTAAQ